MTENILTLQHLHKSFSGLKVINDISFHVRKGSRTALIGPNGAGKTTIFNLLTGVYKLDTGIINLDKKNITDTPAQNRVKFGISRSFQNIRLMPHLSTVENIMLGQHARASSLSQLLFPIGMLSENRWKIAAMRALENAGIGTYPGEVVANLTYGVQKRIEVVRAMISEPRILLLDEPAAGLNETETEELQKLLQRVSENGVTILVVEHDMHFVRNFCDYVIVLNFGRKIFEGTPKQVNSNPDVLEAYLGTNNKTGEEYASQG